MTLDSAAVELLKESQPAKMREPGKISIREWKEIMRNPRIRMMWDVKDEDEPEQFAFRVYVAKFYFVSEDYSGDLYIVQDADSLSTAPVTLVRHRGSLHVVVR